MLIPHIDGLQLHELVEKGSIVIVDFWADWCAPCTQFARTYEKIAANYSDITFAKVDVEKEAELANTLEIRSIPHLLIFKNKQLVYSQSGALPESALIELIEQALHLEIS